MLARPHFTYDAHHHHPPTTGVQIVTWTHQRRGAGFPQVDKKKIQGLSRTFSCVFKDTIYTMSGTFKWLVNK